MTCTPLGVNSHRLLVTGERCAYEEGAEDVATDASIFLNWRTVPFLVGVVLGGVIVLVARVHRRHVARARDGARHKR